MAASEAMSSSSHPPRTITLAAIFTSLFGMGCTPREDRKGAEQWGECFTNVECREGKICVSNKCVVPPKTVLRRKAAPREMVYVPAGTFILGNNEGTPMERPQRSSLTGEFFLDKMEVSRQDYLTCVQEGVSRTPRCGEDRGPYHPVVCVSQKDARTYCTFRQKRLPTEEEWEKGARGMKATRYPWGDSKPTCEKARFKGCGDQTAPSGSTPQGASPFGALDMAGNVWEWTSTRKPPWDPTADPHRKRAGYAVPGGTPPKPGANRNLTRDHFILRGGSYKENAAGIRTTIRLLLPWDFYSPLLGFRCARDVR